MFDFEEIVESFAVTMLIALLVTGIVTTWLAWGILGLVASVCFIAVWVVIYMYRQGHI